MNDFRKKKLLWLLAGLAALSSVIALILYTLKHQTNYYVDPSALVRQTKPSQQRMRVGGVVVENSITRDPKHPLTVSFELTDLKHKVTITYTGTLPDLFKEKSGVIATGTWQGTYFQAESVLAKHDENYMPPEVSASLKENKTENKSN